MKNIILIFACFYFAKLNAQSFQNILINSTYNPNEISISISPKDTNKLVAGANINDIFYSSDAGHTWHSNHVSSPYGVYGDPCLLVDTAGHFYYYHLALDRTITVWPNWANKIILQKSTDGGQNWDSGTYTGYNAPKMQDKEWAAINPKTNSTAVCWTQFDRYGSTALHDSSKIFFSMNASGSWSTPVLISSYTGDCSDGGKTVEGAVPAFGLNDEIYVAWSYNDSIYFNRSLNKGVTWLPREKVIAAQTGGWAYDVAGLGRCNGLPFTLTDHSQSPYKGTIYVNWSDKRNGIHDADIFLIKSADGGTTWSPPIRVNNDAAGKENFMSAMTIDQANGDIYILFYDRRNYNDFNTDVYMAYSHNGGSSFTNYKISTVSFYSDSTIFFGDYIGIAAHDGCVRPAWMRTDNRTNSVWTALVNVRQKPNSIDYFEENSAEDFTLVSANPTNSRCIIHHSTGSPFDVSLYDIKGNLMIRSRPESETFLSQLDEMSDGIYFAHCHSPTLEKTIKVVLMR